jgi:hypothetical protein
MLVDRGKEQGSYKMKVFITKGKRKVIKKVNRKRK